MRMFIKKQKGPTTSQPYMGFTLAEVLITLMVIGILAMITIPQLLQVYEDAVISAKIRKINSLLQNSFQMANMKHGAVDTWIDPDSNNYAPPKTWLSIIVENINTRINCGYSNANCSQVDRYNIDNTLRLQQVDTGLPMALLADGILLIADKRDITCKTTLTNGTKVLKNYCGYIFADINGDSPPNQHGRDIFAFHLTKDAIIPMGNDTDPLYDFDRFCNKNIANRLQNGYGCTDWIIKKANRDYLK